MSATTILLLSGLLGLLSSSVYFFLYYRNMNIERNRLISEVDRLENEFLTEFRQINFDELKETNAGRELIELLQDSEIFPKNIPYENSSIRSIVLNSVQAAQSVADKQNVDFHLDFIDPPSLSEAKGEWQVVFDQLVHDALKYSLRGKFGDPNIVRIFGRKGENYYIITMENYGENLNDEHFALPSYSNNFRKRLPTPENEQFFTITKFIEQQGGKIILSNKEVDEVESELKSENSLNQITLYIPVKQPKK